LKMKDARRCASGGTLSRLRVVLIGMGVAAWGSAVAWQFHSAMSYEATPGERSVKSVKAEAGQKSRVVVVVHPECPCTKATLAQLREIVARQGASLDATVLVANEGEQAGSSENERIARSIPGVQVRLVGAGAPETLGAKTSGEAFYFDQSGKLVYHGGLTEGRGVERPSPGAYCLINSKGLSKKDGEVFGCPLQH
jgi:hypothetical protein